MATLVVLVVVSMSLGGSYASAIDTEHDSHVVDIAASLSSPSTSTSSSSSLLITTSTTTSTSTSETRSLTYDPPQPRLTIPLVPHHVQKTRRRLETGEVYVKAPRPHHYARRQHQQQHQQQQQQHRDMQSDGTDIPSAVQISALYQGYGTHYADLWCGTPPQRQTVIVDTGSGVTAFPCDGCKGCGVPDYHAGDLFHPDTSTTFHKLSCSECLRGSCAMGGSGECKIGMSYQEGSSWTAYEALDRCYVGGFHTSAVKDDGSHNEWDPSVAESLSFGMKFGCQTHLTGLFVTQLADGIMGMDNAGE
jgi:Xylanase inhibitor N-terminal